MSLNPQVTTLDPQVTGLNPRVVGSNPQVTSHKFESTRIIKSMKTQVNNLKSSSFPKNISPKLFGNS